MRRRRSAAGGQVGVSWGQPQAAPAEVRAILDAGQPSAVRALGWPASKIAISSEGEAWGWLEETLTWDSEEDRRVRIRLSR